MMQKNSSRLLLAISTMLFLTMNGSLAAETSDRESFACPFHVASVKRADSLNKLFDNKDGWIGADGAYSIPLPKGRSLWTFGDTFIGKIKGGKRVNTTKMINNTIAIDRLNASGTERIQFFWKKRGKAPRSTWVPRRKGEYYWPADGAYVDGKLYVFLHRIRTNKKLPEPMQFETVGEDLVQIANPLSPPAEWKEKKVELSFKPSQLHFAVACLVEGDYLYLYCNYPKYRSGLDVHPLIVGRINKKDLNAMDMSKIEFYCGSGDSPDGFWTRDLVKPVLLIPDAGPEMTVNKAPGIDGYFAVYMPPLSKRIMARYSKSPIGPWSDAVQLYDCPEKDSSVMLYSGKAHPEYARRDNTLVVTYCRNTDKFQDHFEKPEIYFPQVLEISLEKDCSTP